MKTVSAAALFMTLLIGAATCPPAVNAQRAPIIETNPNPDALKKPSNPTPPPAPRPSLLPDFVLTKLQYLSGNGTLRSSVSFCILNKGQGNANRWPYVTLIVTKTSDKESGTYFSRTKDFSPPAAGKELCGHAFSFDPSQDGLFIGRGRWLNINEDHKIEESDYSNNKTWTNFPPKGQ